MLQDRIKDQMGRLKEIQDKEKAPKLDQGVAKRIVRHALWEQAQKDSVASTVNQSKSKILLFLSIERKSRVLGPGNLESWAQEISSPGPRKAAKPNPALARG